MTAVSHRAHHSFSPSSPRAAAAGTGELTRPSGCKRGDAVLLPNGDRTASMPRGGRSCPCGSCCRRLPGRTSSGSGHGGDGDAPRIICRLFLQCDEAAVPSLLRPTSAALMHVPAHSPDDEWLASTIRPHRLEACRADPGRRSMLPRLTEADVVEICANTLPDLSDGVKSAGSRSQRSGGRHGVNGCTRAAGMTGTWTGLAPSGPGVGARFCRAFKHFLAMAPPCTT